LDVFGDLKFHAKSCPRLRQGELIQREVEMRTEDRSHRFYRCWIPQFASAGLAALTTAVLMTTPVAAQGVVGALAGDWSGSGRINHNDGISEGIRCNAHYFRRRQRAADGDPVRATRT
jgi:hypothetical protein